MGAVSLYTNWLGPPDITTVAGLLVTTVLRALADGAASGLAEEQVKQAVRAAIGKGVGERVGHGTLR